MRGKEGRLDGLKKEKTILEKMAQLPEELQDKMAAQIDGAVMALDILGKDGKDGKEKG